MSTIQDYAYARTCKPCLRDHVTACRGVAWDVDLLAVVACMCGCSAANHRGGTDSHTEPVLSHRTHAGGQKGTTSATVTPANDTAITTATGFPDETHIERGAE